MNRAAASTQTLDRFSNKMDRKFLIALILAIIGPILTLIFVQPTAPLILIFPFACWLILVSPTMAFFYTVALIQFPAYVFVWNIARKMKRPQNPGVALVVFHIVVALVSLVIMASLLGQ
jgi:hypothetical protein